MPTDSLQLSHVSGQKRSRLLSEVLFQGLDAFVRAAKLSEQEVNDVDHQDFEQSFLTPPEEAEEILSPDFQDLAQAIRSNSRDTTMGSKDDWFAEYIPFNEIHEVQELIPEAV